METFTLTNLPPTIKNLINDIKTFGSDKSIKNFNPQIDFFGNLDYPHEFYSVWLMTGEIHFTPNNTHASRIANCHRPQCYKYTTGQILIQVLKTSSPEIFKMSHFNVSKDAIQFCQNLMVLVEEINKFALVGEKMFSVEIFKDSTQAEEFTRSLEQIYSPELSQLITEVNCLANQVHQPDLRWGKGGVYTIWNNGKITWEKSGEGIYGSRSVFVDKSSIIPEDKILHLIFPYEDGTKRYAIVTKADAELIYERLEKIYDLMKK